MAGEISEKALRQKSFHELVHENKSHVRRDWGGQKWREKTNDHFMESIALS